jgi:hypothetical protein
MKPAKGTRLLPKNRTLALQRANGEITTIQPSDATALLERIEEAIGLLKLRKKAISKEIAERSKRLQLLRREITATDAPIEAPTLWVREAWNPEAGL